MQETKALIWLFSENIRRVEKQADSFFLGGGVDAQEIPGGTPEVWSCPCILSGFLPHDLVTGGIPHAGPQQKTLFWGAPKSLQMVIAAMKLKDAYSLEEEIWPT